MTLQQVPPHAFVLRMSHGRNRVADALSSGELVIGWARATGLVDTDDWHEFRQTLHDQYYQSDDNFRRSGAAAGHVWRFLKDMVSGTWVVVPEGNTFHVAEVVGDAKYDAAGVADDSAYRRKVHWLNAKPIPRSLARAALQSRMKIQGTTADASDLLLEIADCLSIAALDPVAPPTFEGDLRRRLVKDTLQELRSGRLDSYGFERVIKAVLLATGGASVRIVPRQHDKGADVTAEFRIAGALHLKVAVQAKHFQPEPAVGRGVVEELVRGMDAEDADLGIVMTSGVFSQSAQDYARELVDQQRRVELVDGEQLAAILVEYGLGAVSGDVDR